MKKIISYAMAAILLGTVTMLVPAMFLEYVCYDPLAFGYGEAASRCVPSQANKAVGGETWDRREAIGLTASPLSNILPAGLMLIPSFLLALGVSLYLKKRIS
ncbi:hypothetical protein GWO13_09695 [Candidatus Bathyarchaeota archaeon]|nr:hypothetical protein [Candidatus Bathyarchaeota archaeon]